MIKLRLTQDAYLSGDKYEYFEALAVNIDDNDGSLYRVTWPITNPDANQVDEMCDWSDYQVYPLDVESTSSDNEYILESNTYYGYSG